MEYRVEKIVCKSENKSLVLYVLSQQNNISFSTLQKLLRTKQIKLNGYRIKTDQKVSVGDIIEIFYNFGNSNVEIVYEDQDILVVNKPTDIEVVVKGNAELEIGRLKPNKNTPNFTAECRVEQNGANKDLISKIEQQTKCKLFAVHRLDRNTSGLVVFAKNLEAKNKLLNAFKHQSIGKTYLAVVVGVPLKSKARLTAFLKKDSDKAMSFVSNIYKTGYEKIITSYSVIKSNGILSMLEVVIETGKTHQIRAHLAFEGFPILGDEKYGNKQVNRQYKKKKQMLIAYKLDLSQVFDIPEIVLPNAINSLQDVFN